MSTRSRIGIENKDGTITSIYCHHDGYINGVGKMLIDHYKDEEKIRRLLDLGDISSLGTEPISNPRAWETPGAEAIFRGDWNELWKEIHPENMCDTYKTRGEDCPAETHKSIEEYQKCSRDCGGEYTYLFKDDKWYVLEYDDEELKVVEDELI